MNVAEIREKIDNQERISRAEAEWLWHNASNEELMDLAHRVRLRFHQPHKATYLLMRIINYTNICVAKCDYCSFYRLPRAADGYVRDKAWIFSKIDELVEVGGDLFGFNGGFNTKVGASVLTGPDQMHLNPNMMMVLEAADTSYLYINVDVTVLTQP